MQTASRTDWMTARRALLDQEKRLTRMRDVVTRQRRALPWVRVEQDYVFDTTDGRRSLAEPFDDRSQLVVYHFMFGPGWGEGCPSCSFWMDALDGVVVHLAHRDVAFVAASRAPLDELQRYRERMGWSLSWVSSAGTTFNHDFHVSFTEQEQREGASYNYVPVEHLEAELPGMSVFAKDTDGAAFHTYSAYARGLDPLNGAYQVLDLVPKGRDEDDLPWTMAWLHRHDAYPDA